VSETNAPPATPRNALPFTLTFHSHPNLSLSPFTRAADNLGAVSHVKVSFEMPAFTADGDSVGVLRILDAIRSEGLEKTCRFYQASTSELFGDTPKRRPGGGEGNESPGNEPPGKRIT